MDFMNINNSYPVGYDLIPQSKNFGTDRPEPLWAQPDVTHAAQLMRQVYEYPAAAKAIARRAAADIRRTYTPEVVSLSIKARLEVMSQSKSYQLKQTQEQLQQTHNQLQHVAIERQESQNIIEGMMTSKFWKLRRTWFKVKRKLGLVDQKEIV
jgi:uncharacterized protein YchJ